MKTFNFSRCFGISLISLISLISQSTALAGARCIHLGDSQSSSSPFAKTLQHNLASIDHQVYTYARPSSRTSHWADVAIANKQAPGLTKNGFKFYPTKNKIAVEESHVSLSDSENKAWAEKVFSHHQQIAPLDCIILQFGDNVDSVRSNKKLLEIVKKFKSETGKCYWVSPTWSEPNRGYSHMNDQKKIQIRREIEASLKDYDCQILSTTGSGEAVDYSFKKKLQSIGKYTSDGLHLNDRGGKMWADEVFRKMKPSLLADGKVENDINKIDQLSNSLNPPENEECQ